MSRYSKFSIVLLILSFVLSSCASSKGSDKNIDSSITGGTSYPGSENSNVTIVPPEQGYPSQAGGNPQGSGGAFVPAPLVVPTPAEGKVVFSGRMLTPGPGGSPYLGEIYLGFLLKPNLENYPPLIKFSETINPKAIVDTEGHFYFANVDPGEYALLIYSLGGTYIVLDDKGQTEYVTGKAGEVVDLGIISVP